MNTLTSFCSQIYVKLKTKTKIKAKIEFNDPCGMRSVTNHVKTTAINHIGVQYIATLIFVMGCLFSACGEDATSEENTAGNMNAGMMAGNMGGTPAGTGGQAGDPSSTGGDTPMSSYQNVYINELNAKGDPSDWIEIYNGGNQMVDLSTCWISDDIEQPDKGIIPSDPPMIIPPQGFALVLLGGTPFDFKLGGEETVILSAPNGEIIDQISYQVGDAPEGASYGRLPDGSDQWQTLYMPTAVAPNMAGVAPECGDGQCEIGEECPADCYVCGDGVCDEDEVCAADCSQCGDGQCDTDEICDLDCSPASCGDGLCSPNEDCAEDCQSDFALVINEISAAGDPEDWIELYYQGDGDLDLSNFFISDDLNEPQKGSLNGLSISSGEFLWLEVSDATFGFKLGGDEAVYLSTQNGILVDFVDWEEGDSPVEQSFARIPDGDGEFQTSDPTPGASN